MTPKKIEQALEILVAAKKRGDSSVGMDRSQVSEPIELLQRKMKIGRTSALGYLKELVVRDAITIHKEGIGNRVESVTIRKESLDPAFHELDEDERLKRALLKYQRPSELQPGTIIVHSHHFDLVQKDADLAQSLLYTGLGRLEAGGYLQRIRKGRNELIMFVRLNESLLAEA